jgi:magnesium transporter
MPESLCTESDKTGLPPGSLVHVGEVLETETRITLHDYNKENIEEHVVHSADEILAYKNTDTVTWVNVEGLVNTDLIESIGLNFNIHALVLEDILNTHQRPKFEETDDYLFLVFKGIYVAEDGVSLNYEQISMLVLKNFVFTFKEKRDDIFKPVKTRLYSNRGRARSLGADYLAYAIMDTVVDLYFPLQDFLDEHIQVIEDELLDNPTTRTLASIQNIKRELIFIRKSLSPLRELLNNLLRCESPLITDGITIFIRDVYDHVIRLTESIDTYRDIITGLLDIYNSSVGNKMNEIMKVLTVFASIFIPLTFIAGIYGMNFEYMPELKWRWAYPALWIAFVAIPVILIVYFKRKRWI